MNFIARDKVLDLTKPAVMGVLNVTSDAFGGGSVDAQVVVGHGLRIAAEGAAIIDVGSESSRPGGANVTTEQEMAQVLPVIQRLALETDAIISVDTHKPEVAEAALLAGAHIVNDITGLAKAEMMRVVAKHGAGVVIMHMSGTPDTMHVDPGYRDVVAEVGNFFSQRIKLAHEAGIQDEQIMLDLGIGFGKNLENNMALLRGVPVFRRAFPQALMVGASRKGFIGKLTGREAVEGRIFGTVAVTAIVARDGVNVVRVHDVKANLDALVLARAMRGDLD
jgi:dihydropteroate synthase